MFVAVLGLTFLLQQIVPHSGPVYYYVPPGFVLSEATHAVKSKLEEVWKSRAKNDRDHDREHARLARELGPAKKPNLAGCRIFLHPDLRCREPVTRRVTAERIELTLSRLACDAFVVPEVCEAGSRIDWVAALTGVPVISESQFSSYGARGALKSFKPAVATKRSVWLSKPFIRAQGNIAEIIRAAANGPNSNWRLLATKAAFLDRPVNLNTIGFVTVAQKATPEFRRRNAFHITGAFKFLFAIDAAKSASGIS